MAFVEERCAHLVSQLKAQGYHDADTTRAADAVRNIYKQLNDHLHQAITLAPDGLLTPEEKTMAYDACLLCVENLVEKVIRESQVTVEEGDNP